MNNEKVDVVADYYRMLHKTRTQNTIRNYVIHLGKLFDYMGRDIDLALVSADDLMGFIQYLRRRGLKNKSINAVMGAVRGFFEYLVERGVRDSNPALNSFRLKPERSVVEPLSADEQVRILEEIALLQENIQMAFLAMFTTGMRVSECASLMKSDVFWNDNNDALMIRIREAKWGSDRIIPIWDDSYADRLWRYLCELEDGPAPLFRATTKTLQTHADRMSDKLGFKFYCHRLRHTFATNLRAQGVDLAVIQSMLGHTSIGMTRWYTHETPDLAEAAKRAGGNVIVRRLF